MTRILRWLNWLLAGMLGLSYLAPSVSPIKFSPIAFFGLAYPILLGLNVLFVCFWLLRRNKTFLISLISLLIGVNFFTNLFQITLNSSAAYPGFKVMSYNVRLFDLYNWSDNKKTRSQIFEMISKEGASVICFQEFYQSPVHGVDNITDIQQSTGLENYYVKTNPNNDQYFGLATFSKFPIISAETVKFKHGKGNSFTCVDLKIKSDTIRVYNAHIGSIKFQRADYEAMGQSNTVGVGRLTEQNILGRLQKGFETRTEQIAQLLAHMKNCKYEILVCGDFNDTPSSYAYGQLSTNLRDAFKMSGNGIGGTHATFPALRIDYIFHSNNIKSSGFKTINKKFSDHYPITCAIHQLSKH